MRSIWESLPSSGPSTRHQNPTCPSPSVVLCISRTTQQCTAHSTPADMVQMGYFSHMPLRSSRRLGRFFLGPLKGVVCDLLPAILAYRVVRASRELLVVCNGVGVAVVVDVRLVDSGRHEGVLAPCYEEQGR